MTIELFGTDDVRHAEAVRLRFAVFVAEQGIPGEIELDEYDRPGSTAVHAVVRDTSGVVIAAGRWYARDATTAQIGRMVVVADARGTGIGARLLRALIDDARARGFTRASLDAQQHAIGFYAKAGFAPYGGMHDDGGIPHQPMRRDVR